jgi:hypothetical protein
LAGLALGLVAVLIINQEASRRRRKATPGVVRFTDTEPAAIAIAAPPLDRTARAVHSVPVAEGRSLPKTLVAGIIAALLVPLIGTVTGAIGGSSGGPSPVVAAEAVDTELGVYLLVKGEHFAPGSSVDIFWHHRDDDTVTTVASESGEIEAFAPLPGAHHPLRDVENGMVDLVVSDGSTEVRQPYVVEEDGRVTNVAGTTSSARVMVNGSPYFLLGANYPWINYGNDFGQNAWGSYGAHTNGNLASHFADMKAKGVHVARWWVFADGRAGINFSSDGTPTGVQPVVYQDLARAIEVARANNIYLNLVLFDVSLLSKAGHSGGVQLGGRSDLLTNSTKRQALVNNVISPVVKAYANEPVILSWEIMNEPEWAISDLPSPAVGSTYNPVTMQQFWAFGSSVSSVVHFNTKQQVTVGSAALKWNKVWTNAFAGARGLPQLNLDFYQTHYYQWMDCCSTNDGVLGSTTWSPLTQKVSALGLDKPIVVGEVHTPSGAGAAMLDTLLANGYAGVWGWSYNANATGDKMVVDWNSFKTWESAHASIVRIPAPGAPKPNPTATVVTVKSPTSTKTTAAPTAVKTATKPASTATRTAAPNATATRTSTRTATRTAPPNATATRTSTRTATKTSVPASATKPPATATKLPATATKAAPAATATVVRAVHFGQTSSAGYNDDSNWKYVDGSRVTLHAGGKLQSLSLYVGATSPGAPIRLAIYGERAGQPDQLIGETGEATPKVGWNTLPIIGNVTLTPGTYWLMAQTNDPETVYRVNDGMSSSSFMGWAPQPYGEFPDEIDSFHMESNTSVSMYGTVLSSVGGTAAPTATMSVPVNTTIVPVNTPTSTRTSTPVPTSTPKPPVATPTLGGGCVSNCGEPRYFCDTWTGGFCDDYRHKGSGATHVPFPAAGDPYSFDAFNTTFTFPQTEGPAPSDGLRAFSSNEHFMTVIEDSQFGLGVLRLHQPFDFAGREGRIHFDVDLKTSARRYVRLTVSPELTKVLTDDRAKQHRRPENGFDLWFVNGRFYGSVIKNGSEVDSFFPYTTYYGQDNVRDKVDVYTSRNRIRVVVNGNQLINEAVTDLGFDRAYVYLTQASYNPCKDGECSENLQMFHWDNVAFDGPVLGKNSLTPAGSRDVLFNAYRADSCRVKGVNADPVGSGWAGSRVTYRVRLPDDGTPVGIGDINCSYNFVQGGSDTPTAFEIVRRY